jgi:hypothetical protein
MILQEKYPVFFFGLAKGAHLATQLALGTFSTSKYP